MAITEDLRIIAQAEKRKLRGRNLTLRTPIHPSLQATVCQNGRPGLVGLAPRGSLEILRPKRRLSARCVRLAAATRQQDTSTRSVDESRFTQVTRATWRNERRGVSRRTPPTSDWRNGKKWMRAFSSRTDPPLPNL